MFLKLGQVLVNGSSRLPNTHCKWKVRNDLVVQAPDWVQQPACATARGRAARLQKQGRRVLSWV